MTDKCDICGSTTVDHNELNCSMNRQIFNRKTSEQSIRADERQKLLAEIEGLVAKVQRKITSKTFEDPNLCLDVMVDIDDSLAELRAKLAEMKGKQ